ncbi:unnamed protein product [Anisakis simplex]|uniref:Nuclear hormone receptor family member odr-7 (inferred by orthology to a C. elegans protein) n=1 Tax=Anisakis simplex TaxID=6269 RepID=A0A0M3KCM0_ANISI|nr:unnamed protein product [Anisakis simplex]
MDNRGIGDVWHQGFERPAAFIDRATLLRDPTSHMRTPLLETARGPFLDNMGFFNDYDPSLFTNLGHNFAHNFANHYQQNTQFQQDHFFNNFNSMGSPLLTCAEQTPPIGRTTVLQYSKEISRAISSSPPKLMPETR